MLVCETTSSCRVGRRYTLWYGITLSSLTCVNGFAEASVCASSSRDGRLEQNCNLVLLQTGAFHSPESVESNELLDRGVDSSSALLEDPEAALSQSASVLAVSAGRAIGLSLLSLGVLLLVVSTVILILYWNAKEGPNAAAAEMVFDSVAESTDDSRVCMSIEDAITQVGIGQVQWTLLIICGLTFCSDAAEVTFLSYVTEMLRCQWGLTPFQEATISSSVFMGMIVGAPVWGWIADHKGRRLSFLLSSAIISLAGFATSLCPNFLSLAIVRSIVGFGVGGLPVGFDILAEALPSSCRGSFLLYIEYFWTAGSIYVTVCARLSLESVGWQLLAALAAVPTLVTTCAAYKYLPESPRWLMDCGRDEEALAVIKGWAIENGRSFHVTRLTRSADAVESGTDVGESHQGIWLSAALMGWVWFSFGVAYYGTVLMLPRIFKNTDDLPPTVLTCAVNFNFQDLAASSCAEALGVVLVLFLIDRIGRCWSQGLLYSCGAAAIFVLGYRSLDLQVLTVVACLARIGQMGATCATWCHTPELFPTKVRAEMHTLMNLCSKVGAFLVPFVISDIFSHHSAAVIMALTSLSAGIAAMCLPETTGKAL